MDALQSYNLSSSQDSSDQSFRDRSIIKIKIPWMIDQPHFDHDGVFTDWSIKIMVFWCQIEP